MQKTESAAASKARSEDRDAAGFLISSLRVWCVSSFSLFCFLQMLLARSRAPRLIRPLTTRNQTLELTENARIPPSLVNFFFHDFQRFHGCKSAFVWPVRSQRIVHIHDLQNPGSQGNLFAFQSVGIAGAIQLFMVMT